MIRTKIIATMGPASDSPEKIAALLEAGVDVFRLNFSHGTIEQHAKTLTNIRAVCERTKAVAAVMADLCGPKIRIDPVANDAFEIRVGDRIDVVSGKVLGSVTAISTNRPELVSEAKVGHRLLIDDGAVRLRVADAPGNVLHCVCEVGGTISNRKGVNLPDTHLAMSALTDADRSNLAWAVAHDVEYIAISFVRSAADVMELRALLPLDNDRCRVVSKIETVKAIANLDSIIEASDVVLVARGDLGVEADLAQVPLLQKQIARKCQLSGKPVIVATQMLQSMVHSPTATRAEVSDVANAIFDAADCVMLSAETSVGEYPVDAVRMMSDIADQTERYLSHLPAAGFVDPSATMRRITTIVAHGANLLARELNVKFVVVWTQTGNTARLLSKCRLDMPILGLSADAGVCRRMAMYYGVFPVCLPRNPDSVRMMQEVDANLLSRNLAASGDLILIVAGTRVEEPGATSALFVHVVGTDESSKPRFV